MKMQLAGIWLWLWGAWHMAWLFGLVWIPFFRPEMADLYFRVLYTVFLPMEIIGAIDVSDDTGRQTAKTLSQFRQFVGQWGKEGKPVWLGWKALAGFTGLIDASILGWIVWDVNPLAGVLMGLVLALWLVPHFGWRRSFG